MKEYCDYWEKDAEGIEDNRISMACGKCSYCLEHIDIGNENWLY